MTFAQNTEEIIPQVRIALPFSVQEARFSDAPRIPASAEAYSALLGSIWQARETYSYAREYCPFR